jgi:HK97 gp10 family phage protein
MAARKNRSVQRLQAILAQLPARVKQPILAATFTQAEKLRRNMIFRVHVGTGGKLRDSIRVEKARREMRVLVLAGGPLTTHDGYDYAIANEFGTKKLPPQPFFFVAYRANKASIRRELKAAAKDAIRNAWRP